MTRRRNGKWRKGSLNSAQPETLNKTVIYLASIRLRQDGRAGGEDQGDGGEAEDDVGGAGQVEQDHRGDRGREGRRD